MTAPLVSVILIVKDRAGFLAQALNSLSLQTYEDFEVLVIDDGSTDNSMEVVDGYAECDTRFKLLASPGQGLSDASNHGIRFAKGEFIARLDSDDVAAPDRFERQVRHLQENPDIVCCGTAVTLIDSQGKIIGETSYPVCDIDIRQQIQFACCLSHPSIIMRRKALVDAGGYRREFVVAEDVDLYHRLLEQGKFCNLPEPLTSYRIHKHQATKLHRRKLRYYAFLSLACAIERAAAKPETLPCDDDSIEELVLMHLSSSTFPVPADRFDRWEVGRVISALLEYSSSARNCWASVVSMIKKQVQNGNYRAAVAFAHAAAKGVRRRWAT